MTEPGHLAFKFLATGRRSRFAGRVQWPEADRWTDEATSPSGPWYATEADHLSYWLHDELWLVELDGPVERSLYKLSAPRARLRRRVDLWTDGGRYRFSVDCLRRTLELVLAELGRHDEIDAGPLRATHRRLDGPAPIDDLAEVAAKVIDQASELADRHGGSHPAGRHLVIARDGATYFEEDDAVTAHAFVAAFAARSTSSIDPLGGFHQERSRQSMWLRRELRLDEALGQFR